MDAAATGVKRSRAFSSRRLPRNQRRPLFRCRPGPRLGLGGDLAEIAAADYALEVGDRGLDRLLEVGRNLVAAVLEGFLACMDQGFGLVLGLDLLAELLVRLGMGLGVLHHLVDVVLGQAARGLDADLLLLAGGLVAGLD